MYGAILAIETVSDLLKQMEASVRSNLAERTGLETAAPRRRRDSGIPNQMKTTADDPNLGAEC